MGLTQDFTGLVEPDDPDFARATPTTRRAYYDAAGAIVLDELSKQLGKGIGRNGRQMKARVQPVLADGADGPVMSPHYQLSRVETLADYMATDHGLKLFWHAGTGATAYRRALKKHRDGKGKKPVPFGTILEYHQQGLVPHAPVRDVRLCKAREANTRNRLKPVWAGLKKNDANLRKATNPVPKPKPEPDDGKAPKPKGTRFTKKQQERFKAPPIGKIGKPQYDERSYEKVTPKPKKPPAPTPTPSPPASPIERAVAIAASKGVDLVADGAALTRKKFAREQPERVAAFYDGNTRQIVLNDAHPSWKDPVTYMRERYERGWFSSPNPDHVIHHELGHALHHDRAGTPAYAGTFKRKFSTDLARFIRDNVSEYASTSPVEFVAETYAALAHGRSIDPRLMALYNQLGGAMP